MKKKILWISGGVAALSVALLALPSRAAVLQGQDDTSPAVKVQRLQELRRIQIDGDRVSQDVEPALEESEGALAEVEVLQAGWASRPMKSLRKMPKS